MWLWSNVIRRSLQGKFKFFFKLNWIESIEVNQFIFFPLLSNQIPPQKFVLKKKIFGIHPLVTEDILNEEKSEKCDLHEDYTFLVLKPLAEYYEETY